MPTIQSPNTPPSSALPRNSTDMTMKSSISKETCSSLKIFLRSKESWIREFEGTAVISLAWMSCTWSSEGTEWEGRDLPHRATNYGSSQAKYILCLYQSCQYYIEDHFGLVMGNKICQY